MTFEATKDPNALLDYQINWADWLPSGESISASIWLSSDPALVIESDTFTSTTTTVRVSGGVNRKRYRLTNRITTSSGLIDDRTILMRMSEK